MVKYIPITWEEKIGEYALQQVSEGDLCPQRDDVRESLLRALRHVGDKDVNYQVHVQRSGPENAYAMPGNKVLVTASLLSNIKTQEELLAVLAHEAGHIHHRHALRNLVKAGGVQILITMFLGNSSTGTSMQALTLLTQLRNSRQFENEADAYALARLSARKINPQALAKFLREVSNDNPEQQSKEITNGKNDRTDIIDILQYIPEWLSTHPDPGKRADGLSAAAGQFNDQNFATHSDFFSVQEWKTLRSYCDNKPTPEKTTPEDAN